jgi:transcriptional regulator with XRE-family HTH domain
LKGADPKRAREIGKRIAQARLEAGGMSQVELADLLEVSERSVSAYENGEVIPYRHMRKLEQLLNKPIAFFLFGKEADDASIALSEKLEEIKRMLLDITLILQKGGK